MSFGDVAIDNHGPTSPWPHASQMAGLIANALGWTRTDATRTQALQDGLVFACRSDREGSRGTDYQTAALTKSDRGWTTRGTPEVRAGGAKTYKGAHIRYRHYWANRVITAAMRLNGKVPDLDRIADALQRPARPLFLGRKPFLPAIPIVAGFQDADSALAALTRFPLAPQDETDRPQCTACAPADDLPHPFWEGRSRVLYRHSRRDWYNDIHAGEDQWLEGLIATPGSS